jgi:hypothetical protein
MLKEIRVETFFNYQDASNWMEKYVDITKTTGFVIDSAEITYVNNAWRAGIIMSQEQGDLFDGDK